MSNYPKAIVAALVKIYRHRRALWLAGRKLGVPTARLLRHDNSKFHPIEFMQYVKRFELGIIDDDDWADAWVHHWRNNDHHIEYWENKCLHFVYSGWSVQNINRGTVGIGGGKLIPGAVRHVGIWMPDDAVREMIADWMAASFAYSGQWPKAPNWVWGNDNLVDYVLRLEATTQPETSTRGFAVELLQKHNMITSDQIKAVMRI